MSSDSEGPGAPPSDSQIQPASRVQSPVGGASLNASKRKRWPWFVGAAGGILALLIIVGAIVGSPKKHPDPTKPYASAPPTEVTTTTTFSSTTTTTTPPTTTDPLSPSAWLKMYGATMTALINDFNYFNSSSGPPLGKSEDQAENIACAAAGHAGKALEQATPLADTALAGQLATVLSTYVPAAEKCASDPDPGNTYGKSTETVADMERIGGASAAVEVVENAIEAAAPGVVVPTPTTSTTTTGVIGEVLKVSGTGTALITISYDSEQSQQNDTPLPWSVSLPKTYSTHEIVVEAQTNSGSATASITCEIDTSYSPVIETSTGPYAVVMCTASGS
jgi:hypothetical protein